MRQMNLDALYDKKIVEALQIFLTTPAQNVLLHNIIEICSCKQCCHRYNNLPPYSGISCSLVACTIKGGCCTFLITSSGQMPQPTIYSHQNRLIIMNTNAIVCTFITGYISDDGMLNYIPVTHGYVPITSSYNLLCNNLVGKCSWFRL